MSNINKSKFNDVNSISITNDTNPNEKQSENELHVIDTLKK